MKHKKREAGIDTDSLLFFFSLLRFIVIKERAQITAHALHRVEQEM